MYSLVEFRHLFSSGSKIIWLLDFLGLMVLLYKHQPKTKTTQLDDLTWFLSRTSYDLTRCTPCQLPISCDVIQLDNFTLFVFETLMNWLYLLPTNFQMTVNPSSHTPAVETTSNDNPQPKLYHAIILFSSVYPS